MTTLSKTQLITINTILQKRGLMAQKQSIVAGVTNGRTERSSQMTTEEAKALIQSLNDDNPHAAAENTMRRKVFAYCHDLGWHTPTAAGKFIVDKKRLADWLEKYGYLHKPLMQYDYKELPKLVSQFESLYKSHLNAV